MDPIVKAENLSVVYNLGKTTEMWALKDVGLEIYPQEYVIFFGPSGCGKSTLLYTIAGLEDATKGDVIIEGKNLKSLTQKEIIEFHKLTIGMIFQAFYLIPNLTVKDNILLPQLLANASVLERKKRADELIERFGLAELKSRKASLLSGGQQQRVATARALINNPDIILADEPTGNLDSKNVGMVLDLLGELNQKDKKTIIHVTHDPRHLHRAGRVFYMQDGKITRIVRNPQKKTLVSVGEKEVSELERIAQAYPYLNDTRLRAKMILNHILYPFSIETQDKIEEIIDRYLLEKVNERQMEEMLDLPAEKGGVSLYKQTAQQLTKKILALAKEIELVQQREEFASLTPIEERAMTVRGFLLDNYKGKISFDQIKRLEEAISGRILGKYDKKQFEDVLDQPFKDGGTGLNRRTAKRFGREVELILMKR